MIVTNQESFEIPKTLEPIKAKYGNIQRGHGRVNILLPPEKELLLHYIYYNLFIIIV